MAETKRKGRGGKLARTEVVQVRLDPKLRFAAELAAAKERRTLSSFVEWAVERAVREVHVAARDDGFVSAAEVATLVWDVDEPDRFVKLALNYLELLTHDEMRRWKFILGSPPFWWKFGKGELLPNMGAIRAAWGQIEDHIAGTESFNWERFRLVAREAGINLEWPDPEP